MHQQQHLVSSGLLLQSWLLLLTVPGALTNTAPTSIRPAGRIAYHRLRLPTRKVDIELLQVDGTCVCRQACFATNCRCYTLVKVEAGGMDCLISRNHVRMSDMVADVSVTTVCYTDYRPFGKWFYRIVKGVSIEEGMQQCTNDGAVVAAISTVSNMGDLIDAMRHAGVNVVYARKDATKFRMLTLTVTEDGPSLVDERIDPLSANLPVACRRSY